MILVTGGTPDRGRGSGRIPARWTKNAGPATRCRSPAAASSNDPRWRWPAAHCSRALGGKIVPHVSDTTAAIQTRWPIKRVVYVMLENRSFDNLFGRFPGVEGTTIGVLDGAEVPLKRCPDWLPGDLPHDRAAALNCWNGGKQDGFGTPPTGDPVGLHAVRRERGAQLLALGPGVRDLRSLLLVRERPVVSRTTSSSSLAPRAVRSTTRRTSRPSPMDGGKQFKSWGCDAVGTTSSCSRSTSTVSSRNTTAASISARWESSSPSRGVDWTFYSAAPGTPGYFWNAYNGVGQVFHTDLWQEHTRDVGDGDRRCAGREAARRHLGHPAVRALRSSAGSSAFTHNWISDLIEADHEERRVGADRDLPHVGRMGRVLRSRPSRRRSIRSGSASGSRCSRSAQYTVRGTIDDVTGSSPTPLAVHRRQLGTPVPHRTGSRTRTTSSMSSTSRSRRAHPRSRGFASRPSDGSISSRRTIPGPREPFPTRRPSEAQPPPIGFGTYCLTRLRAFRTG